MSAIRIPSARGAFRVWQRNVTIFRKFWISGLFPNFIEPLITSWWALFIPPMLLLIGIMFSVMGTLFTSLIPSIDLYAYYFTLVVTPLFLFSGIFFPVQNFPAPVPQVAWFTPLYHAVNVCRELATGPSIGVLVDVAWILIFTGVLALIPVQIMRRRLIG